MIKPLSANEHSIWWNHLPRHQCGKTGMRLVGFAWLEWFSGWTCVYLTLRDRSLKMSLPSRISIEKKEEQNVILLPSRNIRRQPIAKKEGKKKRESVNLGGCCVPFRFFMISRSISARLVNHLTEWIAPFPFIDMAESVAICPQFHGALWPEESTKLELFDRHNKRAGRGLVGLGFGSYTWHAKVVLEEELGNEMFFHRLLFTYFRWEGFHQHLSQSILL